MRGKNIKEKRKIISKKRKIISKKRKTFKEKGAAVCNGVVVAAQ